VSDGLSRRWSPGRPVDLYRTLGPLRRGTGDPTFRIDDTGAIWRAVRTPDGPGTLRVSAAPDLGEIVGRGWGPGAPWLLEQLPALCGAADDPSGFDPAHPLLREAVTRYPGFRLTRAGLVVEVLVPCVLEQKTTGKQARASFRELVHRYGEPAPGPVDGLRLMVAPSAADWALVPSWAWHRAGVEPARSRAVVTAVRHAGRLEETLRLGTAVADQRLRALPGIGEWTSAEIRQRAHGDPDAVSVGDYHLPATVGYSLIGERVDDAGMLELLAPYPGHRYRVCALIHLAGSPAPRRGPRLTIQDHRAH
jgi:3-methyladenine DNA glycosylase/8-oxoguanine DNA glycosylase